jgi:integrase/recombinase XerD
MLTAAVDAYLAMRRTLGYQLRDTEAILRDFAAFADSKEDTHVVTQTVLEWIRRANGSPQRSCVRLRTVVHFAHYLQAEDPRHEVPPGNVFGHHRPHRRPPFLFTPDEVAALVCAARTLAPQGALRPHLYSTLFGLIACTGLRISEALNLEIDDVISDGLVVRNTKFAKSRLLPLHPSARGQLDNYLEHRSREASSCPLVFISGKGAPLHANTVRHVFHRLVNTLGIAQRTQRPRVHDLRFYFANQALTHSPADHQGISQHMVALTTYLGHRDVRSSYWYLEATPALFSSIAERCEAFVEGGNS